MMTVEHNRSPQAEAAVVLTKAVTRAADRLNLSRSVLSKVLGLSAPTVSRMYHGKYWLDADRKEWDFALLFIRVFRSLDSIVGNPSTAVQWLCSDNLGLNGRPLELIQTTEGLVRVVQYLDATRGVV